MDIYAELSDLKRRLGAMVSFGTVVESRAAGGKALVRVAVYERVTDWLPVASLSNNFFRLWVPPLVGMQVTVISPGGDADYGIVIPAIFNTSCKEPAGAGADNAILEAGGNRVVFDSNNINITAPGSVSIDTPTVFMSGDLVVSGDIRDSRGDLTGHTHTTTDGATAKER